MNAVPQYLLVSTTGMAACFVLSVAIGDAPASGGYEELLLQFGALGLCAYMVFQNYRDRDRMVKALERKDDRYEQMHEATLEVMRGCQRLQERNLQ